METENEIQRLAPVSAIPPISEKMVSDVQKLLDDKRREFGIEAQTAKTNLIKDTLKEATEKLLRRKPTDPEPLTEQQAAELERRKAAWLQRRIHEAKHKLIQSFVGCVGKRYENACLDDYQCKHAGQQNAVDVLRDYAKNYPLHSADGNGVMLYGPAGTGKDYLLVGLAKEVINQHCEIEEYQDRSYHQTQTRPSLSIAWLDGMTLFSELRAGMDKDNFDECEYVESLIWKDILILSDPLPPRGTLSDYQASMLFRIIDGRYRDCKPIWTTLNVSSSSEADTRLTPQIVDRLKDGALCIHCDWPSYRKVSQNI